MDPIGASETWEWHGYRNSFVTIDGREMRQVHGELVLHRQTALALFGGVAKPRQLLDPNEVWDYAASRVATLGPFRNVGTASGEDPLGEIVIDADPSNHEGTIGAGLVSKRRFLAST